MSLRQRESGHDPGRVAVDLAGLTHLPTGGALELHESGGLRAEIMAGSPRRETCHSPEDQSGYEAGDRLWQQPELHEAETADLSYWTLARHAPVLSAVMARIHLLWRRWRHGAELDISPATGLPRLSWWAGDRRARAAARRLPHRSRRAQWMYGQENTLFITLDGAWLELRGPHNDRPATGQAWTSRC